VVRSLCGEVTSPTLRASCVAGHTREAVSPSLSVAGHPHETVSSLRNFLDVKLAYRCGNQNAM